MISQHVGNANFCEMISMEQAQEFVNEAIRTFFRLITRISKNVKHKKKMYNASTVNIIHN